MRTIVFLSLLIVGGTSVAEGAIYGRSTGLPPCAMTYGEFRELMGRLREFISESNGGRSTGIYETLSISGGGRNFSFDAGFSVAALDSIRERGTDVRYTFRQSGAPISEVTLTLRDTYREVEISGTSRPK